MVGGMNSALLTRPADKRRTHAAGRWPSVPRPQHLGRSTADSVLFTDRGAMEPRGLAAFRIQCAPSTWTLLRFIVFVRPCPPNIVRWFPPAVCLEICGGYGTEGVDWLNDWDFRVAESRIEDLLIKRIPSSSRTRSLLES